MRMRVSSTLLLLLGALCMAPRAGAQLTIRLTSVPPNTPAGAAIHVAGTFNAWNPGAADYVLSPRPDGGFAITLPESVRGAIEFKFTLGSWKTVETTAAGGDVPNRAATVPAAGAVTITATVAGWRDSTAAANEPRPSTASASVSVLNDSFPIPQLGRTRRVWIYLPPDYATSGRRYPVLYMHDGQNVFDAATSFVGEWGVDETLDQIHAQGGESAIVVAVDHGGNRRLDEYNPWKSADPKLGGGEGDAYVEFFVHTLKPYVDRHYRTRPDRRSTSILGSSMGGLISLYAALKYPNVFGSAGVFSCACWVAKPEIYDYARRARRTAPSPRVYFVSGAYETQDGRPARDQREMVRALAAGGVPVGRAVRSLTRADGKHAEWFWRREFPAAYRWLLVGSSARQSRAIQPTPVTAAASICCRDEIARFLAADRVRPPPAGGVLFVGSSTIRLWAGLEADFPTTPAVQRGFGGSELDEVIHYAPYIVLPYRPRLIVLYAGDNDIASGKSPEAVFRDYKAFVALIRSALPDTRIAFISIKPSGARWALVDKIRATNALVRGYTATDPRLIYVDAFTPMLGADGLPRAELFLEDRLHLNARGYALWKDLLAPVVSARAR